MFYFSRCFSATLDICYTCLKDSGKGASTMKLDINLINGDSITITDDTYIAAWKSSSSRFSDDGDNYYLENIFEGNFEDGKVTDEDEIIKIEGLIGAADWFTIGKDSNKTYKSTAVLSISRD